MSRYNITKEVVMQKKITDEDLSQIHIEQGKPFVGITVVLI